ncbi:MAG: ABC transporter permease subunit [Methylococcales bacterium]|jgi:ABC-2 type transport system permease protein|nr:ABC transporter permease subunit [Methylococcales bacterium]MBT7410403.1 ABC transporter permease subunit [Methylococcales bacterium]
MILTIAQRDFKQFLLSPMAWIVAGLIQFICAWLFFKQIEQFAELQAKLSLLKSSPGLTEWVVMPTYSVLGVIILLAIPFITMRLISEERQAKTLCLLISAPISPAQIILGKYFAVLSYFLLIIGLISLMTLSLLVAAQLDFGQIIACILGVFLLTSSFCAIGLAFSTFSKQPATAAFNTFALLFFMWIMHLLGYYKTSQIIQWCSMIKHYEVFIHGGFSLNDVLYFIIITFFFLTLAIQRLALEKYKT